MENSLSTNDPAPVTPVELIKRQLLAWKELKAQLEEQNENEGDHERFNHIQYCQVVIDNMESDLVMLTGIDA